MKINGIDFPSELIKAIRSERLVVFAGAGISMEAPANLPNFDMLAKRIAEGTGELRSENEPVDKFLGRLYRKGIDVHTRASKFLTPNNTSANKFNPLHNDLRRLFNNGENIRVVTTNFDKLFENAASFPIDVYKAPALPIGSDFSGLVYVHGCTDKPEGMVLTDADFGRAYLTEGWARRFLVGLFSNYSVLFVGYSHDDVVMHYLSSALPVSDHVKRYALDSDSGEWGTRGIKPIIFEKSSVGGDFSSLNDGIKKFSDYISATWIDKKKAVTALASGIPPSDEESEDRILDSLEEASTTRVFTRAARDPSWLEWLDDRKILEPLFDNVKLKERDLVLRDWLAEDFALGHPNEMISLIGKHHMRVNSEFWFKLGREIVCKKKDTLAKWVSVILTTMPTTPDSDIHLFLSKIAGRCFEADDINSLLHIYSSMVSVRLEIGKGFDWDRDNGGPIFHTLHSNAEYSLASDYSDLAEFYKNYIIPNQERLAQPILLISVRQLEKLHASMVSWHGVDFDKLSYRRSAIESCSQDDDYHNAINILIDAVRDSLMATSNNHYLS